MHHDETRAANSAESLTPAASSPSGGDLTSGHPAMEMRDLPQDLVSWVLAYDWRTDPLGIYYQPHLLRAAWPLVRVFYMMRFGVCAHDLDQLSGFLQFLQRPPGRAARNTKPLAKVLPIIQPAVQQRRKSGVEDTASKIEKMQLKCRAQLPPGKVLDYKESKMELTVHDSENRDVQDLRSRTQLLLMHNELTGL